MFWAEEFAEKLINERKDKNSFLLAAGISPSGTVHIGNLRDIMTVYFVAQALRKKGKKAELLFSWDAYDRFRKVPKNIPESRQEEFQNYVGMPYSLIPNPFCGTLSFAKHFEKEFEDALKLVKIDVDHIRYQDEMYTSGKYVDGVMKAMQNHNKIVSILESFRTEGREQRSKEKDYPLSIYCEKCKTDFTKILFVSDDFTKVTYHCDKCGFEETIDITKQFNYKLDWKVDWPMRWKFEGVDFEPGGKDHSSPQGSYNVAKLISKEVFDYQAPMFVGYEFIGMQGLTGKMSSSSGLNINLQELLKIYTPEICKFIYARKEPREAFNISFGVDVPRVYNEFDRMYQAYKDGKLEGNYKSIIEYCVGEEKLEICNFGLLTTFYSFANGNKEIIKSLFEKCGQPITDEQLNERYDRAKYWLETYSPESMIKLVSEIDKDVLASLTDEQKANVEKFVTLLEKGVNEETIQQDLYDIPRDTTVDDKENKKKQLDFFKTIYKLVLNKDSGPALYVLVLAAGAQNLLKLFK